MGADAAAEEQFGPYVVYERLGVGGMATVHRALERGIEGFERIVALKRLLPHLAADATFIKSFVREAKLASLLNHVNIVQIFELGRVATQYFISMEYIDGRDIRRILRHARKVSGPPPVHVTVGLLLQLCDALDYAHHKADEDGHPLGLVHRDVSPSNVLVTSAGQVKVIDFGIAKAQSAQLRTQTGRVKGKLAYMAPEALTGKDLDARSDLFAAGVIAHELLTARPLFASKNEYQTLMKLQRGEVMPPSTFNQSCPPELDAIVLRALAHDPEHRFHHAGELRDELHAMRKQYNLQTADRDIASWLAWACSLEAPDGTADAAASGRSGDPASSGPAASAGATGHPRPAAHAHPRPRPQRAPRRHDDDEAVELAWGSHDEQVSGEPIVLDDVPDVSDKHLGNPSALGAEVRLDLDDLADDMPTPQPGLGRPAIDLAARTVTTPLLPRHFARNRPQGPAAQARASQTVAVPSGPDGRPTVPLPEAVSARLAAPIDDRATEPNAAIAASLHGALAPPRTRTITAPRAVPSSSAPPRNVAAAALPSRPASAAAEPSRGVPMPMAPSRSGTITAPPPRGVPFPAGSPLASAVAAEPSRGISRPRAPSRSGDVAIARSRPATIEPSPGIPVPIEPSHVGPSPGDPSRSAPAPAEPPRSGRPPTSPRSDAGAVSPPREHRTPPPDARTLPAAAVAAPPADEPRDPLRDTIPTERAPTFSADELGLDADTVLSLPAMQPAEPAGRAPDPMRTTLQAALPSFEPAAPPPREPPPPEPPAPEEVKTSTRRQRLITPATALFAEPDPEAQAATALAASGHGTARPSRSTISGGEAGVRRITLGRVLLVIVALTLLSAATTAAALYLTRVDDPTAEARPIATPARARTSGTIHFEVVPADAAISIAGRPVHTGSPWDVELAPGVHQIEIDHDGYKSWLTAIELASTQRQPLRVSLEPLGSAVAAEATLVLRSTPDGLDIVVDGSPRGRTPDRLTLSAGHHTLGLRASGADVWTKDIDARPSVNYEFHPAITPPPGGPPGGTVAPAPAPGAPAAPPAGSPTEAAPAPPSPGQAATAPSPAPPGPPVAPQPSAAPAAPPMPAAVPSTAVTRLAGAAPRITPPANVDLPPAITAKLCIDPAGGVTAAEMITPIDAGIAAQIVGTLRTWKYEPYRAGGAAQPACFPVTFRAK